MAGDQRQQPDRFGLGVVELDTVERGQDRVGVVDQLGDDPVDVGPVVPRARRFARIVVVVMGDQRQRLGRRDQPADPADLGDQLHDRVLTGHRVIEHRRVQRPAGLAGQHVRRVDHLAHRVEDPLRAIRGPQLVAPQRQHRRMEPLIGQRPARRDLPRDRRPQLPRSRRGPTGPPAPAAPSPSRSHPPAPTAGPDPSRTDRRTSHPGTAADDAPPRTSAPNRAATRCPHIAIASNNSGFGSDVPCMQHQSFTIPSRKREHLPTELLSSLLGDSTGEATDCGATDCEATDCEATACYPSASSMHVSDSAPCGATSLT